jgi:hypothetical protein
MSNILDFEYSPWLVILCLAIGVGYGYIQYQKKSPWSKKTNRLLAIVRSSLVSILAILLLGPTVRALKNYYEKPLLVMAIDNSESVMLTTDSLTLAGVKLNLARLDQALADNGWAVEVVDLNGESLNLDSLSFTMPRSNLTGMVKAIQAEYEGANLGGILIVSDGIFNSGFSPDLISTFTPIYSLGLGDTIPRKDLSIINVRHNKSVYQDNLFPVEVSIRNEALGPAATKLKIYQGAKLVDQVALSIVPESRLLTHSFLVKATSPGKQRITLELEPVAGEATKINNRTSFYIDVIEGQQKVLIVADAPSPNIKAMRLAIEQNEHFQVDVNVNKDLPATKYDLIILVDSPNRGVRRTAYQQLLDIDVPKLYIVGSQTDLDRLRRDGKININQANNQFDLVTAALDPNFKGFTVATEMDEWLSEAPPITVPFGNMVLQPTDEVLMYQRIGTVVTRRPVIYFSAAETKNGVIFGEGLWKWRLNEYQKYGGTTRFDELITKSVMFLAAKPDNRQFKFYPMKEGYEVGEDMVFIAETYNELFEPVYGEQINLKITGSTKTRNYTFTPLAGSMQMRVDDLPEGIYNYLAYTTINGKRHQASGQFSVEKPDLEAADLTADYIVLRKLARESGGKFYAANTLDKMQTDFAELAAPAIIHTQKRELLLLNLPWILVALVVLASGEWLTRKMMGGY